MCRFCNDTGSTEKTLWGYLDCGYCDTAEQRVQLERWALREAPNVDRAALWKVFQHGKEAGAVEVARTGA